jgi:hypothetical protein
MRHPSRQEREALLELLLALGGPLVWTGPIPYDALRARHESAQASDEATDQAGVTLPLQRGVDADQRSAGGPVPPVAGTCAA